MVLSVARGATFESNGILDYKGIVVGLWNTCWNMFGRILRLVVCNTFLEKNRNASVKTKAQSHHSGNINEFTIDFETVSCCDRSWMPPLNPDSVSCAKQRRCKDDVGRPRPTWAQSRAHRGSVTLDALMFIVSLTMHPLHALGQNNVGTATENIVDSQICLRTRG